MKHLADVNETYLQHFAFAFRIGLVLVLAGTAVIIHAICPYVFKSIGSDTVKKLFNILEIRNDK